MMNLQGFPTLNSDTSIHYSPNGGTLYLKGAPIELTKEELCFFEKCDGKTVLADIIPKNWSSLEDQVKFLMLISNMIDSNTFELLKTPVSAIKKPHFTGSKKAFIPPHLTIELTIDCNLKCRHCYRDAGPGKSKRMPTAKLLELLSNLADVGLRSVEITGGEPLMHSDINEILELCESRFDMVGVLTNGTIMTDNMLGNLKKLGNRALVSVSLDGSTAESHDLRRGVKGSFNKTVKNLKKLSAQNIPTRVSMCVDQDNFSEIEATLLVAKNAGARAFSYTPVMPMGRGSKWAWKKWKLNPRDVFEVEQDLGKKYEGFLTIIPEYQQEALESGGSCGAGYRTYTMDPYGFVRPCATYSENSFIFGNLIDQPIEEVFSHPATKAFASFPLPSEATCKGCKYEMFCKYCGLRGLHTKFEFEDCAWAKLKEVQQVNKFWENNSVSM